MSCMLRDSTSVRSQVSLRSSISQDRDWSASLIGLEIFLLHLLSFCFPVNRECAGFDLTLIVSQVGNKAKTHEVVIKPSRPSNQFL